VESVDIDEHLNGRFVMSMGNLIYLEGKTNTLSVELTAALNKIDELKELVIWMTGCGYDFCQHEYFVKKRDELLKT